MAERDDNYKRAAASFKKLSDEARELAEKLASATSGGGGQVVLSEPVSLELAAIRRRTRVEAQRFLEEASAFAANISEALASSAPRRTPFGAMVDRQVSSGLRELSAALAEAGEEADRAVTEKRRALGFAA